MEKIIYVAFHGEGPTDERLFVNISERIIKEYLLENNISAQISWLVLKDKKPTSEQTLTYAAKASKDQDILIFHRDADNTDWKICYSQHFQDGLETIEQLSNHVACKKIITLIPVKETEAWMLCDKELFRDIIETDLSLASLGLTYQIKNIESIGDPKSLIENAINLHRQSLSRRRRKFAVNLSEIYERFSQEIQFEHLENLDSFNRFKESIRKVLSEISPMLTRTILL
jgi:hypothetical protein